MDKQTTRGRPKGSTTLKLLDPEACGEVKRSRGRPKGSTNHAKPDAELPVKPGRGRPRKASPDQLHLNAQNDAINQHDDVIEVPEATLLVVEDVDDTNMTPGQLKLANYLHDVKETAIVVYDLKLKPQDQTTCSMCQHLKPRQEFFRSYSVVDYGTINAQGERHMTICKRCCKKIFNNLYNESHNLFEAYNHWCQITNTYFSVDVYNAAVALHKSRKGTGVENKFDYLTDYMTALGRARMIGATYWDSPDFHDTQIYKYEVPDDYDKPETPPKEYPDEFSGWSQDDLANYDYVLETYHYDPFVDETVEDRRKLYYNLAGLSSEDILDDFAKANAAIDTCRSMVRLEKLNKLRILLEKNPEPDIEQMKDVTALQKIERNNIVVQGKEHGFTQKYNLNKTQGAGTFTGIMKQLDDNMYEDALVNAYDIKTSSAMQMAAEASWKAIFGQLNISDSEFAEIVKNQRQMIQTLQADLDDCKEQLRLANIALKKQELTNLLKEEQLQKE